MTIFSHGHRRKAGRELQTELDTMINGGRTLSEKSTGAGHRAVSLHRGCVLSFKSIIVDNVKTFF